MKLRLGFSDQELVEGGADAEQRARDDLRREQRLRIAMTSGHPELARSDLVDAPLRLIEHKPTGDLYVVSHGEQYGENYDTFSAFYVAKDGSAVFLQRPTSGAQTRAELDEQRSSRTAS